MIVVSDTNILSSLAAGNAFPALCQPFAPSPLWIPSAVFQELLAAMDRGKPYLAPVFQAITDQQILIITPSEAEEQLLQHYPPGLNLGERQAIAITQTRKALFLSNDMRAVRYCRSQTLSVLTLENILRQLWVRNILSRAKVKQVIEQMAEVEKLVVPAERQAIIFAAYSPTVSKTKKPRK